MKEPTDRMQKFTVSLLRLKKDCSSAARIRRLKTAELTMMLKKLHQPNVHQKLPITKSRDARASMAVHQLMWSLMRSSDDSEVIGSERFPYRNANHILLNDHV